MNGYQYSYGNQLPGQNTLSQLQQMFPQPQGSVYSINTPLEVGNVPIGSTGLSLALCLQENLMYIKSFQNGNPVIMAYRIAPFTRETSDKTNTQTAATAQNQVMANNPKNELAIESIQEKLNTVLEYIEQQQQQKSSSGGKFDGLL